MGLAKKKSAAKKQARTRRRQSTATDSVRCVAVQVLLQLVNEKGSLTTLLPDYSQKVPVEERALLRELCFGVARWSPRLSALTSELISKPLRRKDSDVLTLIYLGLYQLDHMRIPQHAALNTTVEVTGELGKSWARGLVNAVLRSYLRERDDIVNKLDSYAALACPQWLGDQLVQDWPEYWEMHLRGSNERPPMSLRVNRRHTGTTSYLATLGTQAIEAKASAVCDSAVILENAVSVDELPGFSLGHVSVQDASAQLATHLMAPVSGERILDACAAPGGKTGHLLEWSDNVEVVAVDSVAARLDRVAENLERLCLSQRARLHCADAADLNAWWDGELFDAVLLDAPCSGTGVIRRHPDIKMLRSAEHIPILVEQQRKLLHSLWRVLRPGGRLLYATCSVLKAENEEQISSFLEARADAVLMELPEISHSVSTEYGSQILRGTHDGDGFFYSLMCRSNGHSAV